MSNHNSTKLNENRPPDWPICKDYSSYNIFEKCPWLLKTPLEINPMKLDIDSSIAAYFKNVHCFIIVQKGDGETIYKENGEACCSNYTGLDCKTYFKLTEGDIVVRWN